MSNVIWNNGKATVTSNPNGSYSVRWKGTYNFDGFIEETEYCEIFEEDGIHSGGGVCRHNLTIQYAKGDNRTLMEKAIAFAESR